MQYDHNQTTNEAKKLLEDGKGYFVVLSTKDCVRCDSDEVKGVLEGIEKGAIIVLRQGIINPSFFVSIIEDKKRNEELRSKVFNVLRENEFILGMGEDKGFKSLPEVKRLQDIFKDSLIEGDSYPQQRLTSNYYKQ